MPHQLCEPDILRIGRVICKHCLANLVVTKGNVLYLLVFAKLLEGNDDAAIVAATKELIKIYNGDREHEHAELMQVSVPGGVILQWRFIGDALHMRAVGPNPDAKEQPEIVERANQIIADEGILFLEDLFATM